MISWSEDGGQKVKERGNRIENRGKRIEVRRRRSVRARRLENQKIRRLENRGWRSEVRNQKIRKQRAEVRGHGHGSGIEGLGGKAQRSEGKDYGVKSMDYGLWIMD